jgi:hypothetical protein
MILKPFRLVYKTLIRLYVKYTRGTEISIQRMPPYQPPAIKVRRTNKGCILIVPPTTTG